MNASPVLLDPVATPCGTGQDVAFMTLDSAGFVVKAGAVRPTRIPLGKTSMKALSSDTGGAYSFGEHHLTYDFPPHIHYREDEGIYVLEGQIRFTIGDEAHVLGPGDFIFMPRGVSHSITRASDVPMRFVFVSTPGGFEHLTADLIDLHSAGHDLSSPEWREFEAKHGWRQL